ncbi:MAG: hypothetical protein IH599_04425 [Bacteroidales bacterium]|nr:hypothetical protein [Bacteroidales bacterium]
MKSTLSYDKEEGIWLLESSLTYSLANPSREGSEVLGGTLKLQVPPCSTSISATQLGTIYANLYDSLFSVVSRNELQDAYLEFINLDWTAEENSNFITLEYMFGYGGAASYANSPYGPDDWWWYGMGMGRCNGVVCCQGKDATTEIMRKTLLNMAIPFGHAYFTDVEVVIVRNPMDLPQGNPDPNHCYFPLFYSNGSPAYDTSFHSCLSPFEMNYYYGSIQSLMSQNRPYINPLDPSQGLKVPVGILLVPSEYLNSHGYSVLEHILFIFYGISHPSAQWQPHSW